jgi:hypothetical protein
MDELSPRNAEFSLLVCRKSWSCGQKLKTHQTDVGHDLNHPVLRVPNSAPCVSFKSLLKVELQLFPPVFLTRGGRCLRCGPEPSPHLITILEWRIPKAARHTIGTTCLSQTPLTVPKNVFFIGFQFNQKRQGALSASCSAVDAFNSSNSCSCHGKPQAHPSQSQPSEPG